MLNFTVGPVQMDEAICRIGAEQVPYFRTPEFSQVMFENESMLLQLAQAPRGSRAVFLTASSTGAMEASVMNTLSSADKALVVDGGSFGHRFVQLLQIHGIPHEVIELAPGESLKAEHLAPFEGVGITAFLINADETSTGVFYDMRLVSDFCRRNDAFFIVDAVSAFLTDAVPMDELGIDLLITGSQKALAVPPGVSVIALAPKALERVERTEVRCMYFDLADALKNGERGQTPFTPAVGILLQVHERLRALVEVGGVQVELDRAAALAQDFRSRIAGMPFSLLAESPANGVTALRVEGGISAKDIFARMKDDHGIWVCPNGGDLAETVFRVGHMGALTTEDNETLVAALTEVLAALEAGE